MAWETGEASNYLDLLSRLRRFITGRASTSTPVYTGTGNGSLSAIETYPATITENWTVECIAAAPDGGAFSVVGSVSGALSDAVVGTPYVSAHLNFTISDSSIDFIVGDKFTFTTTRGSLSTEGQAWDLMRSTSTELLVKGKGLGGTDEIYVNLFAYANPTSDIYNLIIRGAAGYVSANVWDNQPGQSPKIGLSLWNDPMKYWFIANGRRFIIVAKVSTFYVSGYFGLMLPYGTPGQYPYPLVIGGNLPNSESAYQNVNYSWPNERNTNYWTPRNIHSNHQYYPTSDVSNTVLYWHDGSWIDFTNGYSNSQSNGFYDFSSADSWINNIMPVVPTWIRENLDGTYELIPHTLVTSKPSESLAGELDGSFFVTGFSNGSENTVTVGADTYLVVQNVYRNAVRDFAAIKLS